ncbi:MAG: hypothetical protein HUK20_06050 [Fibrobacter sp.]|nr:hypothetical protein [Fibrobacter sp.]
MKMYRFKRTPYVVLGVLMDDVGGTYFTAENASCLIPCGTYDVDVTYSPKFKKKLPLLVNYGLGVGDGRGIRIHSGNNAETDSKGCVLVGNQCDLVKNVILESNKAMSQLLRNCGGKLDIFEKM